MEVKAVSVLGAQLGLGGRHPDTALGPVALLPYLMQRLEAVGVRASCAGTVCQPKAPLSHDAPRLRYLEPIAAFQRELRDKLLEVHSQRVLPLIIGGDHALSIGSLAAAASWLRRIDNCHRLGLIWVDAHADINTPETTLSGLIYGMTVAVLLGMGDPRLVEVVGASPALRPERIAYVGLRDLDPGEVDLLDTLGIEVFDARYIQQHGIDAACHAALRHVTSHCSHYALSFDLDACDPAAMPAVSTPVSGGLSAAQAHRALQILAAHEKLLQLEFVEYNPTLDAGAGRELALSLIETAVLTAVRQGAEWRPEAVGV